MDFVVCNNFTGCCVFVVDVVENKQCDKILCLSQGGFSI